MKKFLLLCTLCGHFLPLWAQKVYFLYIESETRSPFYVKRGEQVYSSSSSGYLILAKLPDSTYTVTVGPGANASELRFEIPLKGKDRGFVLKKLQDGWALFDLQSLELIRPASSGNPMHSGVRLREDRFTTLLSQAAADTSLLYQPVMASGVVQVQKMPAPKQVTTADAAAVPTVLAAHLPVSTAPPDNQDSLLTRGPLPETMPVDRPADTSTAPVVRVLPEANPSDSIDENKVQAPAYKRSVVSRYAESSTMEGFGLVYTDDAAGAIDTIRILIPNPKTVFAAAAEQPVATTPVQSIQPAPLCTEQAGEKEFFKLRRNLAAIDSEADMTLAAIAVFRKRCFSVAQVKNLSSLFLTQSGKYAFLEAAYPFVYNRDQFATLQTELFDPAYLARFKALTSN